MESNLLQINIDTNNNVDTQEVNPKLNTDIEMNDTSSEATVENYDLEKFPTKQPFHIPDIVKTNLQNKIDEITKSNITNIETLQSSKFNMYKFVRELMSSIFTEEYLKTHKKSSKGGKRGTVQREVMEPKHLEEIVENSTGSSQHGAIVRVLECGKASYSLSL
ncbi:Uncharacterized protein APZ42_025249 [Daphnia magna]|uniref:Uncharacterized protein n=1 Tax=Daphnia magna TaxID=35525 RepID=A0A164TBL7_9CRUS|nr:Uncharacterized protein APZ42_025249 [Daphnia magna]